MIKLIGALLACLPFVSITAQEAPPTGSLSVLDSLKQSRDFYSNNHLVVVGAAPASFKFDRYPADGPERIQTAEGTYLRQGGQAWSYLPDKMRAGLPIDYTERNRYAMTFALIKEWGRAGKPVETKTAKQLDSWIKLIEAALNFAPTNERLLKQAETADHRAEWIFEIPSSEGAVRLTFRKPLESKDQALLHEFSGPITSEGGKGSATKVEFGFGYMMRANPEQEVSEFAWEEMQRGG